MDMKEIGRNVKPGLLGVAAGAAILALVGFNAGGWVTGSTAAEMANAAVIEKLVPICVGQFNGDTDRTVKLAALKKVDSWKQADYVIAQGWATMPGADAPHDRVAILCASQINS